MLEKILVKRNEVEASAPVTAVKKGKSKGTSFFSLFFPKEAYDTMLSFIGKDEVYSILSSRIRTLCKGWSDEAEEESRKEDGTIDWEKFSLVFSTLAADFSARGETISELQSQIDDLVEQMTNLPYDTDPAKSVVEAQRMATEIKKLQIAQESKRRTKEPETTEAATK